MARVHVCSRSQMPGANVRGIEGTWLIECFQIDTLEGNQGFTYTGEYLLWRHIRMAVDLVAVPWKLLSLAVWFFRVDS